jgi:predicted phage-related endonuclease
MWERFEITTGATIDLLKSLVRDCRSVTEQSSPIETDSDVALKRRVYDFVCELRDNWRAHVEEELADEQRVR